MCNPVKAVKKVFKKIVKHAKIIIPVIIGAAAIYFLAGSVVGGAGVSGLLGQLGLGSTLASVLGGAVTQAGIGAAIGAGTQLVTGGNVGRGALIGAAAGAVTGGITGALSAPATSALSSARGPNFPQSGGGAFNAAQANQSIAANPGAFGFGGGGSPASGVGKFITDNQELIGGAFKGVGAGLGGLAEADATIEAAKVLADQDEAARARTAANFDLSSGVGLLSGSSQDTTPRPTPAQQFTPTSVQARARGARWRYNPETGQVELTTG